MAAYTEYVPGPTISSQYNTLTDLLTAYYGAALPERTGIIGASSSLTWYLSGVSETTGANPSCNLTWLSTTGVHSATTFVRHDSALNGMLDPNFTWATRADIGNWFRAYAYSVIETWRARLVTANLVASVCQGLAKDSFIHLFGGGSTSGTTFTLQLYGAGSARSGKIYGCHMLFKYQPTLGEITAGIVQDGFVDLAQVTDANDGTLLAGVTGGSFGEAVHEVPVPIAATADAQASWLGLADAQLFNKKNVTSHDDLGAVGQKAVEPNPDDIKPVFVEPGVIHDLIEDPEKALELTTTPSIFMTVLQGLAWLVTTAISVGVLTAIAAVPGAIATAAATIAGTGGSLIVVKNAIEALGTTGLANIKTAINDHQAKLELTTTAVGTIKTQILHLEDNGLSSLVTKTDDVKTALVNLNEDTTSGHFLSVLGGITTATGANATATGTVATQASAIKDKLTIIADQLTPATAGSLAKRLVEALESIADSLAEEDSADPPAPKVSVGISRLSDRLDQVARMATEISVSYHGLTVDARGGVIEE